MITLPPTGELMGRCRALAAFDLILSPDWESRFYSFNAHWAEGEQMASMRNGSGDEWWIVFHREEWAALKGLDHESPAWSKYRETLSTALRQSFPKALEGFCTERAFCWEHTSFAYFYTAANARWSCANDLAGYAAEKAGDAQLLAHVVGTTQDYADFAADYYETEVDAQIVAEIFALQPITPAIVKSLNPAASLAEIADELYREIEYPGESR